MTQIVRFDTQALNRALIGFDRIFNEFENHFQNATNYPPHNVIKYDDDNYEIQLAVAGFDTDDISVEVVNDHLIVNGEHVEVESDATVYLHRGLATRNFRRIFPLAEYIEVISAETDKGVLRIKLQRQVPESAKPKRIEIKQR